MAYSNLSYKLANSNKYVDAIGEYHFNGEQYILVEKNNHQYNVYTLTPDGELEKVLDSDIADEIVEKWSEETLGVNLDDENEHHFSHIQEEGDDLLLLDEDLDY